MLCARRTTMRRAVLRFSLRNERTPFSRLAPLGHFETTSAQRVLHVLSQFTEYTRQYHQAFSREATRKVSQQIDDHFRGQVGDDYVELPTGQIARLAFEQFNATRDAVDRYVLSCDFDGLWIDVDCNHTRVGRQQRCCDCEYPGPGSYIKQAAAVPVAFDALQAKPRSLVRPGAECHTRIDLNQ